MGKASALAFPILLVRNLLSGTGWHLHLLTTNGWKLALASARLGVYLGQVQLEGGVARVPITFTSKMKPADIAVFKSHLATDGRATSAVLVTGKVVNKRMATFLTRAAASGQTFQGGVVREEVPPTSIGAPIVDPHRFPAFTITFPHLTQR